MNTQRPAGTSATVAPPPVVGIGASAGGLDALERFFAHVAADAGMAYVVVQHLDPTQKALLAQLLQRVTAMPVREAIEGTRIEADHVYVIPPNTALTAVGGALHLAPPEQPRGLRLPVDVLFASLALAYRDGAIGVVLSGMGTDGTLGLRAIRARGGLTIAQQPESAQFDSMPQSAIGAGLVDIVARPEDMGLAIQAAVLTGHAATTPFVRATDDAPGAPGAPGAAVGVDGVDSAGCAATHDLSAIVRLLNGRGKHDFTDYKRSTLQRRIERRMGIHALDTMAAYGRLLQSSEQELDLLCKELLIGVTSFFRDSNVWQRLAEDILPGLLAMRDPGRPLRAWIAGCSTGEEAYSLAMIFMEVAGALPGTGEHALQIFATDLSKDAIEAARRGIYPPGIVREVSAQRLARFFSLQEGHYRIAKSVRDMVVFAPHNVIADPPFTHLDFLSCRNLLIYLTAPLQQRLLPQFHYSLRPGGVLLLGSSETVGTRDDLFEVLDAKLHLYRRCPPRLTRPVAPAALLPGFNARPSITPKEAAVPDSHDHEANLQVMADRLLLQEFSPAAVLVNERGDIVYINGRTGKYLEPAAGKANWNIHVMAREGLRAALATALRQALMQDGPVEARGVAVLDDPAKLAVDLTVQAIQAPRALKGMAIVVFRDAPVVAPRRRRTGNALQRELELELARARTDIQALHEEMRASREELQASNEELQSTNEELQSTNEELTSSKEEMQSMNEELHAVNVELQSNLDDLALAQSDMQNLLNSTEIATLFLDNDLNVRRFTERARGIISLRESDVGRPLDDLSTSLDYPGLHNDVKEMLRTLVLCEREIPTHDGRWYSVRIMPYRTQD